MSQDKDPLDELAEAVEKARGLIPRGGSSKLARNLDRRRRKGDLRASVDEGKNRQAARATSYLRSRYTNNQFGSAKKDPKAPLGSKERRGWAVRRGVYKSLDALDEAIEKAKGKGMIRGGSGKAFRRTALAADLATGSRKRRLGRAASYLFDRQLGTMPKKGGGRRHHARGGVYKGKVEKAKAKTLYVYRPVENAADIIAWAESQGFKSTQPAEKLHVTLAYSKTPLNWAKLHDDYRLEPDEERRLSCECGPVNWSEDGQKRRTIKGGVREVKALGKDGAVVLAFESDTLTQRWMDFKRAGAAWKFPSFTPHITITYDGKGVDLTKVLPYVGDIVLGEECWEEVSENGQAEAIAAEKVTKADRKSVV